MGLQPLAGQSLIFEASRSQQVHHIL